MKRTINIFGSIDWLMVTIYLFLVFFGWLNIFAVGYTDSFTSVFDLRFNYGHQFIWIMLSFVLIIIIFILDFKVFPFFAYIIYGLSLLLLLLLLKFGTEVNSARSWFRIFGFSVQPSEFAKIGVSLALAKYLSSYGINKFTLKTSAICAGIIGAPFFLILMQPDPGTALVFAAFLLVLFREGLPGWILALVAFVFALFLFSLLLNTATIVLALIGIVLVFHFILNRKPKVFLSSLLIFGTAYAALFLVNKYFELGIRYDLVIILSMVLSGVVYIVLALRHKIKHVFVMLLLLCGFIAVPYSVDLVFHKVMKPHQQKRINIMLGKEQDPKGYGYNLNQSKIAIGSGGFSGKGFLEGTQTKFNFVPEQSTDFIFCTIGEEWGFIGTSLVLLAFAGLLIRIIMVAERQRSKFTRVYAYAVASVLFIHVAVNTSMTIGLFPVIGIPLPFFSYGGSSLMGFSLLLFILIRLDAVRKAYL
ncbi:MAG: rod shape-determining protein RodA [Bacteroidales bacterium]